MTRISLQEFLFCVRTLSGGSHLMSTVVPLSRIISPLHCDPQPTDSSVFVSFNYPVIVSLLPPPWSLPSFPHLGSSLRTGAPTIIPESQNLVLVPWKPLLDEWVNGPPLPSLFFSPYDPVSSCPQSPEQGLSELRRLVTSTVPYAGFRSPWAYAQVALQSASCWSLSCWAWLTSLACSAVEMPHAGESSIVLSVLQIIHFSFEQIESHSSKYTT